MKKLLSIATFSIIAFSLAACGGGGGGGGSTSTVAASEKEFVAGTVTGFGSVIVMTIPPLKYKSSMTQRHPNPRR
jgi:hypothetical protein